MQIGECVSEGGSIVVTITEDLLGKLIPKHCDQITDYGRGRVAMEHAIRRNETGAGRLYENA